MDKLQSKSALFTDYHPGTYGLTTNSPISISDRRDLVMINIVVWDNIAVNRALKDAFDLKLPAPGKSANSDSASILWIGANRYMVVSGDDSIYRSMKSAISQQQASFVDLSSARTVIRIEGAACRNMMAKGLTVELDGDSYLQGDVILSSIDHHYPAIIHNVAQHEDQFDIYITRSFALSFWEWLCDSSLEYGYQVR